MAALNCSETGRLFRAWIGVTNFISTSFPDAEFTTVRWFRMVAFPLDDRNTRTTGSRTLAPRAPLAPSAVDLTRFVHNWHAFLVLTPLRQNSRALSKISLMAGWLIYSIFIYFFFFRALWISRGPMNVDYQKRECRARNRFILLFIFIVTR